MADLVWGELAKSQIDPEKIEEAIVRLIAEHNEDEEAHIGVGQSLQSHKASEIIDHKVNSVVSDIVRNREITIEKLNWNRFLFQSLFESLDGFSLSEVGTGAKVIAGGGGCRLLGGAAEGNETKIFLVGMYMELAGFKEPFFQCRFGRVINTDWQDIAVCSGPNSPFAALPPGFGFRWKASVEKMYIFSCDSMTLKEDEVVDYDESKEHVLRAAVVNGGEDVLFYVDDVKVGEHNWGGDFVSQDNLFVFALKNYHGLPDCEAYLRNLVFSQNW